MSKSERVEDVVTKMARQIESVLNELEPQLESSFEEWVTRHGLGRANTPEVIVARQASFNVLLKATLYEAYRREGMPLPELDPSSYHDMIDTAAETVGDTAFRPSFLDRLASYFSVDDISRLIKAGEQLHDAGSPAEDIGRLYEQFVPQEDRRKLGQFRTPPVIAGLMAEWVIQNAEDTVLDPGIGAGVLSVNAYQAKKHREGESSLEEVRGVDISELSVLMGDSSLHLANGAGCPRLTVNDFLNITPGEGFSQVDAIICNPPYSRHHELDQEYKQRINERMENEAGLSISALSPLYSYFYIHASEFLKKDGRMTFITPSEFLETNYGETLKQFLLDNYHIRAFLLYDRDEPMFTEAMTTSCISFLDRKADDQDDDDKLTKFIRVDDWPGRAAILDIIRNGEKGETEWGFVNTIRQRDLDPEDKWDDLFNPLEIGTDEQLIPLSEIGNVDRGIATGKNDYFCLSEPERVGSAGEFEWTIEEEYLSPLIRSSRSVPYYDYLETDWERQRDEGEEVWLLYHLKKLDWEQQSKQQQSKENTQIGDYLQSKVDSESQGDNEVPSIVDYLRYGMTDEVGADDSYLARNRNPWYLVDRRKPAPILYTYMSRERGRFVHNKTEARNLNNLHSIYLDVDFSPKELKALLGYLNSEFADTVVKRSGRTYSTGMDKIEPAELEDVPVIDPRELDEGVVHGLAELFDELCEAARQNAADGVIKEIDRLLTEELKL